MDVTGEFLLQLFNKSKFMKWDQKVSKAKFFLNLKSNLRN